MLMTGMLSGRLSGKRKRGRDATSKWREFIRILAYVNQPLHKSWWCGSFVIGLPRRYSWAFQESSFGYYSLTPKGWEFYYDYLCPKYETDDLDIYKWIMKKTVLPYMFRGVVRMFEYGNSPNIDNLQFLQLSKDYPKIFNKKFLATTWNITLIKKFVGKLQRHVAKEAFERTLRGKWNYRFSYVAILDRMGIVKKDKKLSKAFYAAV